MRGFSGSEGWNREPRSAGPAPGSNVVALAPWRRGAEVAGHLETDAAVGLGGLVETHETRSREFVLVLQGEFDLFAAPELQSELARLRLRGARRLIVDLTESAFIDASTLGVLVAARRSAVSEGGDLVLVCRDSNVLRVLEVTLLDRVFTVFETRAQALAARASLRVTA